MMRDKIISSSVLAIGDRAMGLYDVPFCDFLFGLGMGIILQSS